MAMRMVGSTVTEIKNQVCSTNSAQENRRWTMAATVDHTASMSMAKMSPRIPSAETTLVPAIRSSSRPSRMRRGTIARVRHRRRSTCGRAISRSVTCRAFPACLAPCTERAPRDFDRRHRSAPQRRALRAAGRQWKEGVHGWSIPLQARTPRASSIPPS